MIEPTDATPIEQNPAEESPEAFVRRWLTEISLAEKAEHNWREYSRRLYKIYESGELGEKDMIEDGSRSFNILWSNTETLLPAVYNSAPQPDVRRRFRDDDKVGKHVAKVLERSLAYTIDVEEFYDVLEDAVLDVLLPGRGLARVKYEPTFIPQMMPLQPGAMPGSEQPMMQAGPDGTQQPMMEKADEKCLPEHVQWDDFIRGPGKRWRHVPWIAFRHRLVREKLVKMFGEEKAALVGLNFPEGMETKKDEEKMAFASAEVLEVWDKDTMTVFFIAPSCAKCVLSLEQDPMELEGFWPVPRPMYAIKNTRTMVPRPIYRMYARKAEQLELISRRIDACVRICKLRGVYDATLVELEKLLDAEHADMIGVANAAKYYQMGGFEKALWMMPVDKVAGVLAQLYAAESQCKQTIYEITGISDVIRGATDPNETASAQKLKAQFGGLRLKTLQREVRRFGRDLMRLMADVMSSKYDAPTFAAITGLQFPTGQEKAAAQQQLQQAQAMEQQQAAQAQITGIPPQEPAPADQKLQETANSVSWDEIIEVMRSDRLRSTKVDVETDSTIADTLETDMQDLQAVLTALIGFIGPALPLVQQGVLTMDALKSVCMQIVRRARMGSAVEDAIEAMQAPPPPQPQAPPVDPMVGVKDAVGQIMEAMKKPKRLVAQADATGRVEGELTDA